MEFLVIWIICGVVTGIIASSKGRNGLGWFLLGSLLGIFGLILIACLPSLSVEPVTVRYMDVDPKATKVCPDCAETILAAAKVCKHCGVRFNEPTEPRIKAPQRT